jgi:hypothetical protein
VQTNAARVSCSMTRDYSDATAAPLRLLAAVVRGDAVDPPAPEQQQRLLELAREHRIEHLAAWRIGARDESLEAWFGAAAGSLREEARTLSVVDAVRNRELATVLAQLSAVDGALPLVFKGAALAHSHYPHAWLRPRLDADILVSPSSTASVFDALRALGYARTTSTSGTLVISQASFTRTDRFGLMHALDVHWKIANWQVIARVLSHADLASRSVAVPALGAAARAACGADALLLACLHRAAHHRDSEELLWIYDIHLIAEGLTDADWASVLAAAERGGVKKICSRGLALANDDFDARVPADVMHRLADAGHEPSSIYLSKDLRLVDGLVSDLRALPFRDRIRLIAEHVCPPAEYIRQKYGLTSRRSLLLFYARRLATGIPRWFVPGDWP